MPSKEWIGRPEDELRQIGEYYGYPECCVSHFVKMVGNPSWNNYVYGSWAEGTGYIPCPECLERPKRDVIKAISDNRRQRTRFPNGDFRLCKLELGISDHA